MEGVGLDINEVLSAKQSRERACFEGHQHLSSEAERWCDIDKVKEA